MNISTKIILTTFFDVILYIVSLSREGNALRNLMALDPGWGE